jgi:hypothetical protein
MAALQLVDHDWKLISVVASSDAAAVAKPLLRLQLFVGESPLSASSSWLRRALLLASPAGVRGRVAARALACRPSRSDVSTLRAG